MAKRIESLYQTGKRSKGWLKIKFRGTANCLILGYTKGEGNRSAYFGSLHIDQRIDDFPFSMISAEFEAFNLYAMYLPHKKKHTLFEFLIDRLKLDRPTILCVDFNTGYNFIDQKGNSFWFSEELNRLKKVGYFDAFRHTYPETKEYSWYSHKGNGFRYDHIWIHQDILPVIKNCYYVQEVREKKVSDHALQILELQS